MNVKYLNDEWFILTCRSKNVKNGVKNKHDLKTKIYNIYNKPNVNFKYY